MTKSCLNGDLGAFIQDVLPKYQSYYSYCFYNKTVNHSYLGAEEKALIKLTCICYVSWFYSSNNKCYWQKLWFP